ncbi:RNA methyltransferase [Jannaschia rubra]|uniref:tRNA (cytidine/uridine-2'-O-)-methyltransferase TrmJ n=1 Tax=Jannaschia rubra TaxID=282197 RepID=A0A0M6XVP2_9RHOB|nr:RNA methyltransferase [Jannaschia rubra]CTQ34175.1 putative tRNA/rRNA methyltransferase [Jannaschia rubra]SFG21415.1 tRNA/rRNA methyltransferase [Jannaschia rubra]
MTDTPPAFILVRPQMGENIGAAARSMLNFGLDHMRVVAPRDGWPNERAVALASGAGRVLDAAMLAQDTGAAVGDCSFVFATTARDRDLTKPVYSPEAAMAEARARGLRGERVAILFGPERTGLENDDIALANAIVSVPTNPAFASLNLAQCVLLIAYEWRRACAAQVPVSTAMAGTEWATQAEVSALSEHFERTLDTAGFFWPEGKAPAMKRHLRNLWSRLPLTRADVQTFHGMMRQMVRWKERG